MAIPLSHVAFHATLHKTPRFNGAPDEDDLVDTTCTHKNLLTERCEINRIPETGRSCAPSEERKLLLPSTSQGFLPAVDLSDGGPFTASRDSCPGADAKFLAGFMVKNFVAGASHPGQMEREGVTSAPRKVHSGKQAAGVAAGGKTAAPSGAVSSHTVRCAGSAGHGATGAARPERSLQAGFSRIGP